MEISKNHAGKWVHPNQDGIDVPTYDIFSLLRKFNNGIA